MSKTLHRISPAVCFAFVAISGVLIVSNSAAAADQAVTRVTFLVSGLHCPPCTNTVEQGLRGVKGVRSAKVDWGTKTASVDVDETVTSVQSIAVRVATTPHMMGGQLHYQAWLTVKIPDLEKPEIAERTKGLLAKIEGVDRVVTYPKQGIAAISFEAQGTVTTEAVLKQLSDLKPTLYRVPANGAKASRGDTPTGTQTIPVSASTSSSRQSQGSCPHCRGK